MILVFILLGIILCFVLIILLSSIRIKVCDLVVQNLKINEDYKLYIQVYFINKIKIFSKKINMKKTMKLLKSKNINKLKNQNKKIKIDKENIKIIFNIKPIIEMLKLNINFGYEDACITSYLVAISNGLLSIFLPFFSSSNKKINYSIKPVYGQNILDIYLNSIISIKVVHIIYVILKLIKKGSMKNERTSNRRFDAYCHE